MRKMFLFDDVIMNSVLKKWKMFEMGVIVLSGNFGQYKQLAISDNINNQDINKVSSYIAIQQLFETNCRIAIYAFILHNFTWRL